MYSSNVNSAGKAGIDVTGRVGERVKKKRQGEWERPLQGGFAGENLPCCTSAHLQFPARSAADVGGFASFASTSLVSLKNSQSSYVWYKFSWTSRGRCQAFKIMFILNHQTDFLRCHFQSLLFCSITWQMWNENTEEWRAQLLFQNKRHESNKKTVMLLK